MHAEIENQPEVAQLDLYDQKEGVPQVGREELHLYFALLHRSQAFQRY